MSSNEVGSSGKFAFSQVALDQENTIRIVVSDNSGNKNEQVFQISVDTEEPVVKLAEMPSLLSKPNFTISGTASEPVIANVFVDFSENGAAAPQKIKDLASTKVKQNSIEIKWEESNEKDFEHYIIYRNSEAIAITMPANFLLFSSLSGRLAPGSRPTRNP